MKNIISIFVLSVLLVAYQQLQAQPYTTQAEILSSGGGESTGGNYSNFSIIGEPFVSDGAIGGDFENSTGFIFMETAEDCTPDWSVNIAAYQYSGNIIASVEIDGTQEVAANDVLAAFYNGECRGVTSAWWNPGLNEYDFLLAVYSNAPSGETMDFKYFKESTCEIFDLVESIPFTPDMIIGGITDPFIFHNTSSTELNINLTAFLEGPVNGSSMETYLNTFGMLPNGQPFDNIPWNYAGTENVASFPSDVVDWVLVELRDATDAASAGSGTVLMRQAALLLDDGSITGLDGISDLQFNTSATQQLFAVIYHRNHLAVISANPLTESGGVYTYDFSDDMGKAYGGPLAQKQINGIWCMIVGDADANGQINNVDKNDYWLLQNGNVGYNESDFDMSAIVQAPDKDKWETNTGKGTQVPE